MKVLKKTILMAALVLSLTIIVGFSVDAKEENSASNEKLTNEINVSSNTTKKISNKKSTNENKQEVVVNQSNDVNNQLVVEKPQETQIEEVPLEEAPKYSGMYYSPSAFLTPDQTAAVLTFATNDYNVKSVNFVVWTADGTSIRSYSAPFQPDGRFASFMAISDFGKTGKYNCLATVEFYDGHVENKGFAYFDVTQPTIGNVAITNQNGNAGTFDVVLTNINCPSASSSIDVVAFTSQDFSDAYVYKAYWNGSGFVANVNVANHQYHFGTYGVIATIHANNGTVATASKSGVISMPKAQLGAYTADGMNYFLIADNTPANPSIAWVDYIVWNQGVSDMRVYRGFRDGNRWLAILPISDYMKTGTYMVASKAQMNFGPQIDLGAMAFSVKGSSVGSVGSFNRNNKQGTFGIVINNPQALGGVSDVRTVVFSKTDWSDAYAYGCLNLGNGIYILAGDIANHRFNYGTYVAAVFVKNAIGIEEMVGATSFKLTHPIVSTVAWPINNEADVTLSAWNLPYLNHIAGIRFYVWNQPGGEDMRSYMTTSKNSDGSYSYVFSMSDFGKMGTFYVLPEIIRSDLTTERLALNSFVINNINGNYGIMGSSGTTIDQMVRYFNKYGEYPFYYQLGYGGAPSINDFCRIFYEECAAENVRAEVAFCQAMKETGYLRFGGAVDVAAFNFAGIGAVDSSPGSYNWFPDIRTGIRAQVQHLKAYASTDPLNNACVDPRFNLVTRGIAPCVEDLGGKWASGAGYGYSIRSDYISKLFAS